MRAGAMTISIESRMAQRLAAISIPISISISISILNER
jgi:hypothetical protein